MTDRKPQLGEHTTYPDHYAPELLVSIPREEGRKLLSLPSDMHGQDIWTGYELSWLTPKGKPCVAIAEFRIDCHSPYIVESKSFKLYLNSLNQCRFDDIQILRHTLESDVSRGFGGRVSIALYGVDEFARHGLTQMPGVCIDDLDIDCVEYERNPSSLRRDRDAVVTEQLYSHLLKTNCPVTGQPDWATICVDYRGPKISREGLLEYLVSFRQHQDFHENCVETVFSDIIEYCVPDRLAVYARYTRRGGLDINPYRSTGNTTPNFCRLARQ